MEPFFSLEAVARLLNKTPGDITEALKESDQTAKDKWLSDNISSFVEDERTKAGATGRSKGFDEGHGKAKKDTLTAAEKLLRDKHGVEGDTLEEIVDNIALKSKEASKLNPDDVKNSSVYLEMETAFKDRIKKLSEDLDSERTSRERDKVMTSVKSSIETKLTKMGYQLPDDAVKKAKWLKVILDDLEDQETIVSLNANGEPVVLGPDKKAKVDNVTMRDIAFDDHLNKVAGSYLFVATGDGKEGTGNKNGQGNQKQSYDFSNIKSSGDYINEMSKINLDKEADKAKAMETWYEGQVKEGLIAE